MIYLLTRATEDYAIIDNDGCYSWWCDTLEEAWTEYLKSNTTFFTTIKDFLSPWQTEDWRVIETYTREENPELFI